MHPLLGVHLKMMRAQEHANALDEKLRGFLDREPHFLVAEVDENTFEFKIRTRVREETDPYWSVILGDFLHDLRSALDHLVYALALQHRQRPRGTQFPIFMDHAEFKAKGVAMLGGVSEPARTLIDGLQPYQSSQPESHPLARLAALSNADKHRLLQATAFNATRLDREIEDAVGSGRVQFYRLVQPRTVKDDAVVAHGRVVADSDFENVKVNIRLATEIFVDERWPIREILGIQAFMETNVIPRFEPFFT